MIDRLPYRATMPRMVDVPVDGTVMTCPACLTPNDKRFTIANTVTKHPGQGSRIALIARCAECGQIFHTRFHIEAQAIDVYYLQGEDVEGRQPLADADSSATTFELAIARYEEGMSLLGKGDFLAAYTRFSAAYAWLRNNDLGEQGRRFLAALLNNMGHALDKLRYPGNALKFHRLALDACDPDDYDNYGMILNNIGAAFLHLGELSQAQEFHQKAYELHAEHSQDRDLVRGSRSNLAFVHRSRAAYFANLPDLISAIGHARRAVDLDMQQDKEGDPPISQLLLGNLLASFASSALSAGDLRESRDAYAEAAQLHLHAGALRLALDEYQALSKTQRSLDQVDDAIESLRIADELEDRVRELAAPSVSLARVGDPNE
jgi:tetratricopeptide (TPR) repeat protein